MKASIMDTPWDNRDDFEAIPWDNPMVAWSDMGYYKQSIVINSDKYS